MLNKNILYIFLFLLFPFLTYGASLSISPTNATFETDGRVTVRVVASSDVPLNAISGKVLFPTSHFSIESVSKSGSILNFWVTEPSFSRSNGTVSFEGVALSSFKGQSGTVLTVTLRPLKVGTVKASFESGQILSNDGNGTDITGVLNGANFTIVQGVPKKTEIKKEEDKKGLDAPVIKEDVINGLSYITGTSKYVGFDVLIVFTSKNNSNVFVSAETDEKGEFEVLLPTLFDEGQYNVNAVLIKGDEKSDVSNTIVVDISRGLTLYEILMISVVSLLVSVLGLLIYLLWRLTKSKKI